MTKYLRRKKDGRILVATRILNQRSDYVPYDQDQAARRIAAGKKRLAELDHMETAGPSIPDEVLNDSKELAEIEAQIEKREKALRDQAAGVDPDAGKKQSEDEIKADQDAAVLDNDEDIAKISRMRSVNVVELYIAENFGEEVNLDDVPAEKHLKFLKDKAISLRSALILESGV